MNISKKPFLKNQFEIYNFNKKELGNWLNVWFPGEFFENIKKGEVYTDEMWTVKEVDLKTANHLYGKIYNPILLKIMCPPGAKFKEDEYSNKLYNMKSMIDSIDDSSFGIWFFETPYDKLKEIRLDIMKWISNLKLINGEDFLNYCESLGGTEKDYN